VAVSIGYSSPSLLSMVVKGRRQPSDDLCEALLKSWQLPLREREYFRLLVKLGRVRQAGRDPAPIVDEMRRLAGNRKIYVYDDAQFAAIRDWYVLVVKVLASNPGFREDPAWISQALRKKVTPVQAQTALEKLIQLGILARDLKTGRLKAVADGGQTGDGAPSAAIRSHHAQMLERARESLEDRPMQERLFNSLTFKVSPDRIAELRERLADFVRSINEKFSDSSSESVFQLCLQFFEHTSSVRAAAAEDK
jgi:uncharacterized protein (TIGR02147 family)